MPNKSKTFFTILKWPQVLIYILVIVLPIIYLDINAYYIIGILLFIIISYNFYKQVGTNLPIRELIIILAALQWIIGPILAYLYTEGSLITDPFKMMIEPTEYFRYVLPASLLFFVGLTYPLSKKSSNEVLLIEKFRKIKYYNTNYGIVFIITGLITDSLSRFIPESFLFLGFLISNLKFVGLYYILLSKVRYKWIWIIIVLGSLLLSSIEQGMFHLLLLWSGFFILLVSLLTKISSRIKIVSLIILIIFTLIIQSMKNEYRAQVWLGRATNNIEIFTNLFLSTLTNPSVLLYADNLNMTVIRVNQGWIIARIIYTVPNQEPYAEGETIANAFISSLVPRFLAPDKIKSGGKEYFERFTGKKLYGNTSMDLSTIGEAYANFGPYGGAVFMFLFGMLINIALSFFLRKSIIYPTLLLWLPYVFIQVVKAEGDFGTALNHFTKSALLIWLFFSPTIRKFFGLRTLRVKKIGSS
jgi:hypothetical protein